MPSDQGNLLSIPAFSPSLPGYSCGKENGIGHLNHPRSLTSFNGVGRRLKSLDAQLQLLGSRVKVMESRLGVVQETQQQMLGVLVGIQRRLEAA
ncbi:hypothetical protein AB0L44_22340 [Nonomuraea wenchangensis]|uniref:hypothetical protein n=1 Tax=Nonomuraea wenchangensis TaxID=568860 RepID=UPI0034194838